MIILRLIETFSWHQKHSAAGFALSFVHEIDFNLFFYKRENILSFINVLDQLNDERSVINLLLDKV